MGNKKKGPLSKANPLNRSFEGQNINVLGKDKKKLPIDGTWLPDLSNAEKKLEKKKQRA